MGRNKALERILLGFSSYLMLASAGRTKSLSWFIVNLIFVVVICGITLYTELADKNIDNNISKECLNEEQLIKKNNDIQETESQKDK